MAPRRDYLRRRKEEERRKQEDDAAYARSGIRLIDTLPWRMAKTEARREAWREKSASWWGQRRANGKGARPFHVSRRLREAARLRVRGSSYSQIASELDISPSRAWQYGQMAVWPELIEEARREIADKDITKLSPPKA